MATEYAKTGHIVGATYRSAYWGFVYRVVETAGDGVRVEMVEPSPSAAWSSQNEKGHVWTHATALDPKDEMITQPCRGCGTFFPNDPERDYCERCTAENGGMPLAPFAVMNGLQGGYLPNTVEHCADVEEARAALVDMIERAADAVAEMVETSPRNIHGIGTEDVSQELASLRTLGDAVAEVRGMTPEQLASGYSVSFGHDIIEMLPLDPADYDPETDF